ncbi:MAG: hypothetical protein HYV16_16590 [Gammaproteobacteria bacterium]|nr:hypothetical protein [Gammaproteobacteria bacterium]
MSSYTLNVLFNQADLPTIYAAGQKLIIMKSSPASTQLAWVAVKPFESNSISWTDDYAMYASQTQIQSGATIQKLSQVATPSGVEYIFENGMFDDPQPYTQNPNAYATTNDFGEALTFGLAQSASVNGSSNMFSPLNAQLVPNLNTAEFIPVEQVIVFLQSNVQNAQVISIVSSPSINVDLTTNPVQTIQYQNGQWIQQSSQARLSERHATLLRAVVR